LAPAGNKELRSSNRLQAAFLFASALTGRSIPLLRAAADRESTGIHRPAMETGIFTDEKRLVATAVVV